MWSFVEMLSYKKFHSIVWEHFFFLLFFFDAFRHQLLNETIAYFVSQHQISTAFGTHNIQFCRSFILLNGIWIYGILYLHMPRIKCFCRALKIRIFCHLQQNEIDSMYCVTIHVKRIPSNRQTDIEKERESVCVWVQCSIWQYDNNITNSK